MSVITPVATTMRRIAEQDNPAIAAVIRTVSAEYGLTADKGYTVADPNLDALFQLYSQPGHAYWVIEQNGQVVGGGGVGKSALTIQFIQVEGPHQGGCPRDLELSPLRDPRSPVAPRSIIQPLL